MEFNLEQEIEKSAFTVQLFCQMYDVTLTGVSLTEERGFPEPAYHFSDKFRLLHY